MLGNNLLEKDIFLIKTYQKNFRNAMLSRLMDKAAYCVLNTYIVSVTGLGIRT